jgi:photosystem II stability/assembly factor-like uncharacterized protein
MIKNILFFLLLSLPLVTNSLSSQTLPLDKLQNLKARNIGPGGMSGRITSIDVQLSDKSIIYVGTASGGLWKSENAGMTWNPIFDKQTTQSVGVVKIQQSNPDVIWVGTGEGNPRNSVSSGNGLYKSIDGGRSWEFIGMPNSRSIHRIEINRTNPNIITVGVTGNPWADSKDRGIFQTRDGGNTWRQVLYLNERTGCADLVSDPVNPNKMIASMWEHRRWPWTFKSGGVGSGLYITYDGGLKWEKMTKGLPKGELGRIGISIAHSSPNVVYAIVESKKNAFFRSDDGGHSWSQQTDKGFGGRPFYYADIFVDPSNENRIYSLHGLASISEDGGKNWNIFLKYLGGSVHPDHHAFWIDVDNPDYIIEGNDGGLNFSRDRGNTWRFANNIPVAQFYHINIDNENPYNVYGGMQDNGSWVGPSRVRRRGGIRNSYWEELSFGDGFDVVPDAHNSRYGYSMYQEGNLIRYDRKTGNLVFIKPVHPDGKKLRFHWNAAIAHDNFEAKTIYYGSQFVHKSTNRGDDWTIISPDLTTNDSTKQKQLESGGLTYDVTGAENHTTILCISQSRLDKNIIWTGTDDGNVQLTRDGGKTWLNLADKIKGAPKNAWVPQIHPSPFRAEEAYVVINNYRQGDWTPHLYRTKDFGQTWVNLCKGHDNIETFVRSFIQDPVEENLMFLGTETGLYVSITGGRHWTKWTKDFPSVPTLDMKIHPREHDLIIGTFGRAAWIIDDIRPLRELAKSGLDLFNKDIYAFASQTAYLENYRQPSGSRFPGDTEYSGENKRGGAAISFFINKAKPIKKGSSEKDEKDSLKEGKKKYVMSIDSALVEIFNSSSERIRKFKIKIDSGFNRISWGLDSKGVRMPNQKKPDEKSDRERGGGMILAGEYLAKITYNKQTDSTSLLVEYDERSDIRLSDEKAKMFALENLSKKINIATEAMDRLREAGETIDYINTKLKYTSDAEKDSITANGKSLKDSLKSIKKIVIGDQEKRQGIFRRPDHLSGNLGNASYYIQAGEGEPSTNARFTIQKCDKQIEILIERTNEFFETDWKEYKRKVDAVKFDEMKDYEKIDLK